MMIGTEATYNVDPLFSTLTVRVRGVSEWPGKPSMRTFMYQFLEDKAQNDTVVKIWYFKHLLH
jgi:hypothetical protein